MTYILDIRQRRQVTLPTSLLIKLGVNQGDQLLITEDNKQIVIKAKKRASLDALKEIQAAFKTSGITEANLQRDIETQRKSRLKTYLND